MHNHLPPFLHRYFWEIDPATLDVNRRPRYVVGRLLEYGDFAAVRWMASQYTLDEISAVVRESRRLSRRSANFWAKMLGIPPGARRF